ncbi:porin family protein [Vibrio metschnikovii]|uniref:porin family protein n=1 Tax=Vibrio metschnikovii TaxID=28172 RepID=UPI0020C6B5C5|nr:porin family protein [Vibrio metschnikovii]
MRHHGLLFYPQFMLPLLLSLLAFPVKSDLYMTPYFGYTLGGKVEDQQQRHYDIKPSENIALAIETSFQTGRIGFFYSHQSSQVEQIDNQATMHYLHFQSSIYYPLESKSSAFIGVGLGGSYADVDWVNNKYGFSSSVFAGIDYKIASNLTITSHFRWLGTMVDNDTSAICQLEQNNGCVIGFRSNWMNQFAFNLGLSLRF